MTSAVVAAASTKAHTVKTSSNFAESTKAKLQNKSATSAVATTTTTTSVLSKSKHSRVNSQHIQSLIGSVKKQKGSSNNNGASSSSVKKVGSGENTGRWTKTEHECFVQGLDMYGKEWKKIANMIETRTVVQIRTHAQKYFQKIAKTKFEQLGKQVPTDLMSTASNTSKLKKGSPLSLSEALSVAADVPFGAKRETASNNNKNKQFYQIAKQNSRNNNVKENSDSNNNSSKSGSGRVRKSSELTSHNINGRPFKVSKMSHSSKIMHTTDSRNTIGNKQQKLTISTSEIRKKNDEEDLEWMVSSMTGSGLLSDRGLKDRRPDSSPTGVADLGLYRTFGSSSSSSGGESESEQDVLSLYDGDSLLFEASSISIPMISSGVNVSVDPGSDEEQLVMEPEEINGNHSDSLQLDTMDKTIADW
eukprot:CAMPEP_0204842958 /NCGR_PEP_ID=MMETSP1346-20131115/47694_1 /ASSEMBLY_ACC=CAM_ASM_000771 /TAXON_ID=215587 /ORGANISM="Aplanochytrium stocchinoi, Strain GSBS06" /LENGTH=417 /DNA_ID=CAMNT_0051982015 /DNA_START=757 /DNA_END=2008 /DNA_ORIENTATION=+